MEAPWVKRNLAQVKDSGQSSEKVVHEVVSDVEVEKQEVSVEDTVPHPPVAVHLLIWVVDVQSKNFKRTISHTSTHIESLLSPF